MIDDPTQVTALMRKIHYGLESAKPDLQSVFKKPGAQEVPFPARAREPYL